MINNFLLQKSDMISLTDSTLLSMSPKITKTILDKAVSTISTSTTVVAINYATISAIEEYNTENGLSFKNRIKYSIITSGGSLNVLYSYFVSGNTSFVICVTYDNGNTNFTYNENNKMETSRQGLSTHIIALANIVDIQFGQYSSDIEDKLFNDAENSATEEVSYTYMENIDKILNHLYGELMGLLGAGQIRSYIKKFNIEMNKYNVADYRKNIPAYNIYIKLWTQYISIITQIVQDYESTVSSKKYTYLESIFTPVTVYTWADGVSYYTISKGELPVLINTTKVASPAGGTTYYTAENATIDKYLATEGNGDISKVQKVFTTNEINMYKTILK